MASCVGRQVVLPGRAVMGRRRPQQSRSKPDTRDIRASPGVRKRRLAVISRVRARGPGVINGSRGSRGSGSQ
ncbi:hypothetical protein [Amycolatopsis balhimycina]|uniref:hypothetical protein n=1 Tax=Amycolatopsis balhimycina TaxID=208443 RepID=UPI0003A57B26|nr:hypothetical protein [Amycolatopsis balhimycina]